jgi:flagellin-like protein
MANSLKKLLKRSKQHRAVAPIIATLIMVAIAVVGGVMVYVFTQGFFTGTQTQAPTTDAVSLTGYDAREVVAAAGPPITGVTNHNGVAINFGDTLTTDGKIAAEEITLHVKNLGTSDVTLSKVEVNFVAYTYAAAPAAGNYAILTGAGAGTAGTNLPAGQEATLILSMSAPVAAGASIPIELVTGSGSTFTFHATIGQRE